MLTFSEAARVISGLEEREGIAGTCTVLIPPALMMTALWNLPLARGDSQSVFTLPPPALWPKIVTLSGSPPNCSILFWIQLRASIWSSIP